MIENLYLHNDSRIPEANGPWFNHEYISYFSVLATQWIMNEIKVPIQKSPEFNDWPVGPNHIDLYKEKPQICKKIDSNSAQDCALRNGIFSKKPLLTESIEPWKIIVYYCTEPDLLLDCDLDLHWTQKIVKGSHGLRHMQVKLFGLTVGQSKKSFLYHLKAAENAWNQGNKYWAYRFLSRATHYLADLGHPFHVKIIPYRKLFQSLLKPKQLFKTLAAVHSGHEVYVQYRFRHECNLFRQMIIKGVQEGLTSDENLFKKIDLYRKNSSKQLSPIYNALMDNFGQKLINAYSVMEEHPELDSSKQVIFAQQKAQEILFANPQNKGLKLLDELTAEALYEVGFMEGLLFTYVKNVFV